MSHNKYKRWVRRFPKHSINEESIIGNEDEDGLDNSSPGDDDDDDGDERNFVFVPRNQSTLNPQSAAAAGVLTGGGIPNFGGDPNGSIVETASIEESSPFSSDAAVRRRTIERLDSVISVGSR